MKQLLKLEYLALFVLSVYLFSLLPYAWWWYPLLLLVPDTGMVGYLINARLGAVTYNLTHSFLVAIALYLAGALLDVSVLQLIGVVVIGHAGTDRAFGFGLKHADSFKHTHLGNL